MSAASSIPYTVGEPMRGTRWVVRGKLGEGGGGVVLAVEKEGVIQGAMKVLHPAFATLPEFAQRFLDEVRVTARLRHENIVQVLDFDRLEDGTPFMVMERLQGRTLGAAIREARGAGKCFTPANTYAVAQQVAEGLYRAHDHHPSIVHRDVKPDNLYLHRAETRFEPVVKVMDFGVAAMVGEKVERLIGTLKYMAPEQVAGERLSPQTDQYALGLVIYEMLTGRLPWRVAKRKDEEVAQVRLKVAPARPSRFCPWLPEDVEAALLKALSVDPRARHDTVHGLMFGLRGLQWVSPRSTDDDSHATIPTVGTLAEVGSLARDDGKTLERMTVPDAEAPLELIEPSCDTNTSAQTTLHWEGRAEAVPAPEKSVVTRRDRAAAAGGPSTEPPATAESGRAEEASRRDGTARFGAERRTLAAAGALAVIGALVSVAVAASSRSSGGKAPPAAQSQPAAPGSLAVGETVTGPAAEPSADPVDAREGGAELAAPAWLAAQQPTVAAGVVSAAAEASPAPAPVRKAAAARSRPALRPTPVKASVPDDGRDELYVPEGR